MKKWAKLLLMLPVLFFSCCDIQDRMLYYPGKYLPSSDRLAAERIGFWPRAGADYRGFIGNFRHNKEKGTIVVFHGNAGTAADRAYYVHALGPLGYRVILAEYPGYGTRKGTPGEGPFILDAKETLRIASEEYGEPIYVLGESLGCGVAAEVAKESSFRLDGIILITPWDTLQSIAKEKFPWLPVRWFLKDNYDTIANLRAFQGKIAVVGAELDRVIPIRHAEALYASLSGDKRMWTIKGAGHNDWVDSVDQTWWQAVTNFIEGKTGTP